MPIEIREVVIRATITENQNGQEDRPHSQASLEALKREVVAEVMQKIRQARGTTPRNNMR